jgi:hypothetical protein
LVKRRLAVVAVTLAAAGAVSSPAAAFYPTTLEYGSSTQAPDSVVTGRAICDSPKRLVGGGFALDPAYDPIAGTGAQALVQQAFPGDRRGWKARAFALPGGTDSTFYTAAVCRKSDATRPSVAYPIAAATHLTATVACKPNRHVTGGGYMILPPYDPATATGSNVSVHTSRRIGRETWLIGATRDFGEESTVIAFAFCERDIRGPVSFAKESVDAEEVGQYSATAVCPAGEEIVSGGFRARPLGTPGSAMTTGLFPWISANGPPPDKSSWLATIHNSVGSLPGAKLTAFAYCKPP